MQNVLHGQVSHSVHFYQSDLRMTQVIAKDGNTYEMISIGDLQQMEEVGKPSLPVKYVKLIVPSDQEVEKIVLKNITKQSIQVTRLILPVQPPIPISVDFHKSEFVSPDLLIYESDIPYPYEIVEFVHDGYFDGSNHIVTLAVYPLQYKPKSGQMIFYTYINFELKMKQGKIRGIQYGIRSKENQQEYNKILEKIVDNPQDIPSYRIMPTLGKTIQIQTNPLPSYEYVIITNSALKDKFKAFVSWKRRKGLNIGIVTMDSILAHYTTDNISGITDAAGALRQYLADSYNSGNPKTMWALLAGDYSVVPIRYGCGWNSDSWTDDPDNPYDYRSYAK